MKINTEPMIKQKEYSREEYLAKKIKSFGVAKRIIIMQKLSNACLVNIFVSLDLFFVTLYGINAISNYVNINVEFSSDSFVLWGGVFIYLCCIFLVLFAITSFWYAIGYKKLEIICIHLDGSLEGALEVDKAAQKDTMKNSLQKGMGLAPTNYSYISGISGVAINYLINNNIKLSYASLLKRINMILILSQIFIACGCVLFLVK